MINRHVGIRKETKQYLTNYPDALRRIVDYKNEHYKKLQNPDYATLQQCTLDCEKILAEEGVPYKVAHWKRDSKDFAQRTTFRIVQLKIG